MKPAHKSASSANRLPLIRSLVVSLLSAALAAGGFGVRTALAASRQTPIEALHVPELDAEFSEKPLFASELAKLKNLSAAANSPSIDNPSIGRQWFSIRRDWHWQLDRREALRNDPTATSPDIFAKS